MNHQQAAVLQPGGSGAVPIGLMFSALGVGAPLNSCQGGGALGNSSQASEEARVASHVASTGIAYHMGSTAPRCQAPGLLEARWPLAFHPFPFCPSLLRAHWPQHMVQSEHLYSVPELPALTSSPCWVILAELTGLGCIET